MVKPKGIFFAPDPFFFDQKPLRMRVLRILRNDVPSIWRDVVVLVRSYSKACDVNASKDLSFVVEGAGLHNIWLQSEPNCVLRN